MWFYAGRLATTLGDGELSGTLDFIAVVSGGMEKVLLLFLDCSFQVECFLGCGV